MDAVRVLSLTADDRSGRSQVRRLVRDDPRLDDAAAATERRAVEALAANRAGVDCVVWEYGHEDAEPLVLLERIRARWSTLPVVVVATDGSERVASAAIRAGVTDYVPAPTADGAGGADGVTDRIVEAAAADRENEATAAGRESEATAAGRENEAAAADRENEAAVATDGDDSSARVAGDDAPDVEYDSDLFRYLLDRSNDAVLIADYETGRYVDANETACRRLGYDREELRELTVLDVEDVFEDASDWREHTAEIRREGTVVNEGRHRRKDGTTFPVELTIDYVRREGREFVVAIARDITSKRRRETRLERQNRRLEQYAKFVSHDLRSPLVTAGGYLDLLADAYDLGDTAEVARIRSAHERMETLIDNFLSFAREDPSEGSYGAVSLPEVIEDAWDLVDGAEAATLECSLERTVTADRSQLQQVFENLFRNAVDHGTPPVTVDVGPVTVDGRWRGFYVADDGPGIPPAMRDSVLDPGVSTADGGTGYGLAIVAEIVAAHDWSLAVGESSEGGARIEITTDAPEAER